MYAVVEIAGQQFKVAKADKIMVPLIESEIGTKLTFDKVLFWGMRNKRRSELRTFQDHRLRPKCSGTQKTTRFWSSRRRNARGTGFDGVTGNSSRKLKWSKLDSTTESGYGT